MNDPTYEITTTYNDFRGRTCGECAWRIGNGNRYIDLCRCKSPWQSIEPSDEACPAFVAPDFWMPSIAGWSSPNTKQG